MDLEISGSLFRHSDLFEKVYLMEEVRYCFTVVVIKHVFRDWSLITGRGGYKTGGGGHVKFYPYEKGGAEKVLAMLKGGGGHEKFRGSFYVVA